MSNQIEEEINQIEKEDHQTEEEQDVEPEQRPTKLKRNVKPLTEEEKDRRRILLGKAREKKKSYKQELEKYRENEKEKPVVIEKPIVEKPLEKPLEKPKKPKKQIIREVIKEEYETDSEDTEEEVVERVKVKKIPRPAKEQSKNDIVNLTYRERLQQQFKDEKMKMIYTQLFDY